MRIAKVTEIKQELKHLRPNELIQLCNRLAIFKKENKELMTYLLFEQTDEITWVQEIIDEMNEDFSTMNLKRVYYVKKSLRKVLRKVDKYSRISNKKSTEIELRLAFLKLFLSHEIELTRSKVLKNMFDNQIKKIDKIVLKLHEDLQYDYNIMLAKIKSVI